MYTAIKSEYPDDGGSDQMDILDPEGVCIAIVLECYADALLSHLNR